MYLTDLLGRLDAKKKVGDGWQARCPAHDDRKPSLSVREGDDGRILVKCHAGCTVEAVVRALGLQLQDLFAEPAVSGREIIATYDYVNAEGKLLYQVVRFVPRDFRQRRPDGNGGWTWNLNGVDRVLYRLPAVEAAVKAGKRVFITEGEKDVHAVEATGWTATCNPGGAGKWRSEYSATLKGADIVVVADRDEVGYRHAADVARALKGVASKVVVVEPTRGKDITDHLEAGRKICELVPVNLEQQTEAPRNTADGKAPVGLPLQHISELLGEPDEPENWLVDGLLPTGGLSVLVGKPKAGKSTPGNVPRRRRRPCPVDPSSTSRWTATLGGR
jgi:hypothetical protein